MNRLNVMAHSMHMRLVGVVDWLSGCSHRRTTFPITLGAGVRSEGQQTTPAETYISCLDCGRHFAYDWTAMRVSRRPVVRAADVRFATAHQAQPLAVNWRR
jgi:hypothetical protein